jgi:hypothetical protein
LDPSDLLNVDPMLGPLQDNGGPTWTMALLPGSPAIDVGDNTDAPDWDQRGEGFPRIVNGVIDIGAFEVQPAGGASRPEAPAISGDRFRLADAALLASVITSRPAGMPDTDDDAVVLAQEFSGHVAVGDLGMTDGHGCGTGVATLGAQTQGIILSPHASASIDNVFSSIDFVP